MGAIAGRSPLFEPGTDVAPDPPRHRPHRPALDRPGDRRRHLGVRPRAAGLRGGIRAGPARSAAGGVPLRGGKVPTGGGALRGIRRPRRADAGRAGGPGRDPRIRHRLDPRHLFSAGGHGDLAAAARRRRHPAAGRARLGVGVRRVSGVPGGLRHRPAHHHAARRTARHPLPDRRPHHAPRGPARL